MATAARKKGMMKSFGKMRRRVKTKPKVKTDADVRKGWVKTYEDRFKPKVTNNKYKVGK